MRFETVAAQPPRRTERRPVWHDARVSERPRPTRADYVYWETVTTRWADIDVYGHMNNARYFELIDTVVNNQLVHGTGVDIRDLPAIGVVAEVSCRYFAEVGYPDPVDVGVAAEKVGRSSVIYRVGLFQGDVGRGGGRGQVRARVRRQHDPARPVTPMPDEIRAVVEPLLRPAASE